MNHKSKKERIGIDKSAFIVRKKVVSICFLVIASAIFVLVCPLFYSRFTYLLSLRQELANKKQLASQKQLNLSYYESGANYEILDEYENLKNKIVTPEKSSDAILQISKLMEKNYIIENEFTVGNREEKTFEAIEDKLYAQDIKISGVGTFENILNFLDNINNSEYFYHMKNILLSTEHVVNDHHVFVELHIDLYYFADRAGSHEDIETKSTDEKNTARKNPFQKGYKKSREYE